MIRVALFALVMGAIAAILLLQLTNEAEVTAWELLLLVILVILVRLVPKRAGPEVARLYGRGRDKATHTPRSVASFELAAVHAFSESPGADRRLKVLMRRIATHKLRRMGMRPGSARAAEVIDPVLFAEGREPLTASQLERIVDQLERL